ncbi:MAG TPA: recombinase family protein, partial [Candidatus Atribacteria bacterium]|nr:recombinase family protein [Candidatus Atribacteria bacterium]
KGGELKINDDEAKIVKNIYSWYISGKGLGEIAKMLNSAKVPTKKGGFWAKKTISSILKNPVYCGYFRWENKITKSRHQSIIEEETFKKVQKIIEQRGGKSSIFDF